MLLVLEYNRLVVKQSKPFSLEAMAQVSKTARSRSRSGHTLDCPRYLKSHHLERQRQIIHIVLPQHVGRSDYPLLPSIASAAENILETGMDAWIGEASRIAQPLVAQRLDAHMLHGRNRRAGALFLPLPAIVLPVVLMAPLPCWGCRRKKCPRCGYPDGCGIPSMEQSRSRL